MVVSASLAQGWMLLLFALASSCALPSESLPSDPSPSVSIAPSPAVEPATSAPLAPVEVRGERFYSGGVPYFLSTNFLTNGATYPYTHAYFSEQVSEAQREEMVRALLAEGHNAIFLYTLNQGDYDGKVVSPYRDRLVGGTFDEEKLGRWRAELEELLRQGLRPVLWLFADDSRHIQDAPVDELKRYIGRMVGAFDDLPILWVLALEADEYWDRAQTDELGSHLKSLARNPVGVHQRAMRHDYMISSWVDFGAFQYGFGKSWEKIYRNTLESRPALGGKPFLAAEYDRDGGRLAQERGLAAAFAGAAGVGTGAPPGLAALMATLPDGLAPSRSGAILTLGDGGVTVTADMATLEFSVTATSATATPLPIEPSGVL